MTRDDLRLWAEDPYNREGGLGPAILQALDDLNAAEAEIRLLKGIHPFVTEQPQTTGTVEEQAATESVGLCVWCQGAWRCSLPPNHNGLHNYSLVR